LSFLVFFDQFNFCVGLADLKMSLADFWTQNDELCGNSALELYKFLVLLFQVTA